MSKGMVRTLVIAAIVLLNACAWYSLISSTLKETQEYNGYVQTAKEKTDLKLYAEADDAYMAALNMKDTIGLRKEIAEFYEKCRAEKYEGFCVEIMEKYPYEAYGYEKMIAYYKDQVNYSSCFDLFSTANKRKVQSENLETMYEELSYKYTLEGSYEDVGTFSNGYCAVKRNNDFWGYINVLGKTAIQYLFPEAHAFTSSGFAAVKTSEGQYQLIDMTGRAKRADGEGKNIEDCGCLSSGKMAVKYNGKYHYCDENFKEAFGSYDFAGTFSCGVTAVREGDAWSVIDEEGKKVTEQSFEDIATDERGVAFYNDVAFAKRDGKYILIDVKGSQVGNGAWDDVDVFHSGQAAAVKNGEKWGFINAAGEEVIPCQYSNARSFSNGFAAIAENGKWGYIDSESQKIKIECNFAEALDFNEKGCALVKESDEAPWTLLKIYRLCR